MHNAGTADHIEIIFDPHRADAADIAELIAGVIHQHIVLIHRLGVTAKSFGEGPVFLGSFAAGITAGQPLRHHGTVPEFQDRLR